MKKIILHFCLSLFSVAVFAQSGNVIQGAGAINMSMGGAATGQALDISGALLWNPASISAFDNTSIKLDFGLFFAAPELSSSIPADMIFPGSPAVTGTTEDTRGAAPMPALAVVWAKPDSKHTFGLSVFAISGLGLTYPQEEDHFLSPNFDPNNSNVILWPQAFGGFGEIQSDYMLMQISATYAYAFSDKFSIGIQPNLDYAALKMMPNPTTNPTLVGYPHTESAGAIGFGGQIGLYFDSGTGFKAGASYKTEQFFNEFEFENTYDDNSTSTSLYKLNFPSIISVGVGYSMDKFDFAVDYRFVDYENTDGLGDSGWNADASVAGFGWQNMSMISAGIQFKGIEKLPIRVGYTYNSVPVTDDLAFFSSPFPAVVDNAFQVGFSFVPSDKLSIDAVYHHGMSSGVSGLLSSPTAIDPATNPLGQIPGTNVNYSMSTDLIMIGASYTFVK